MDESTRLNFLLGNLRVPNSEITTEEWLRLIAAVLKRSEHWVKYFGGFGPIEDFLNGEVVHETRRETNPLTIKFSRGINGNTRCLFLCDISSTKRDIKGEQVSEWNKLYLTQKGEFLLWDAVYKRFSIEACRIEAADRCSFTLLSRQGLRLFLKTHPGLGMRLLGQILAAIEDGLANAKMRTDALSSLAGYTREVLGKIQA